MRWQPSSCVVFVGSAALTGLVSFLFNRGLIKLSSLTGDESNGLHPEELPELPRNPSATSVSNLAFDFEGQACPRVYVYDIKELWDFETPLDRLRYVNPAVIWGERCKNMPDAYKTEQFSLSLIVLYKLFRSKRCRTTDNPKDADLFLVPVFPERGFRKVPRICNTSFEISRHLVHLKPWTAHRHLILLGKMHDFANNCKWWKQPEGLLKRVMRVSHSLVVRSHWKGEFDPRTPYGPIDDSELAPQQLTLSLDGESDSVAYPHSYSVPKPSHIHWHKQGNKTAGPRRITDTERPLLAVFVGRVQGPYGERLRTRLVEDCTQAGVPACKHVPLGLTERPKICDLIALKNKAEFCITPGGLTPYRRVVFDDLLIGCIPVVFSRYMQLANPWHWGHFRNNSQIYINSNEYVAGKIGLFALLKHLVRTGETAKMREVIQRHGHAVQYALDDFPGDAMERILIGAKLAADRSKRLMRESR